MKINNMMNAISNCFSVLNISFLFLSEAVKYYTYKDYDSCVDTIVKSLAKKNILYVKIFQACALNNDLIRNDTLLYFTDNSPYTVEEVDMDTLSKIETDHNITILNNFTPINTGMISLVFKGIQNETQEAIIIKIKRKNIEERLNDGIEKILFLLKIIDLLPFDNFDIPKVIHKNIGLIRDQTDFSKEIENINNFKEICNELKFIKIPTVYPTKLANVILMEHLNGDKIQMINDDDVKQIYIKQIFKFIFTTIFIHGISHGDLHSGNVLFIKEPVVDAQGVETYTYKLGILDFGIIYNIGKTSRTFCDIVSDLYEEDMRDVSIKLLTSGIVEPVDYIRKLKGDEYEDTINIIQEFLVQTIYIEKKINLFNIYNVTAKLNVYLKNNTKLKNKLYLSDDCVKIQVIFGMLHGVLQQLCKKKYIEMASSVLTETFYANLICDNDDM